MRTLIMLPLGAALLAGCATTMDAPQGMPRAQAETLQDLATRVAEEPRNPERHLALGQAWDRLALRTSQGAEDRAFARAAYDSALRLSPADYRARMLAGRADYQAGEFAAAQEQFAAAVMAEPRDAAALLALAAASYQSGDLPLAELSAARASELAGERPEPLRLLALARAARGDDVGVQATLQALGGLDSPATFVQLRTRAASLLRTASVDPVAPAHEASAGGTLATEAANQVSVDVAIVLSQNTRRQHTGMNLLDGLRLQYAYNRQNNSSRSDGLESKQRTITEAISTPTLNYNLNIFNAGGQYYQVVARPTLTAYRGETSEFFVGRTAAIPISGVNVAQLERVDIGITLKVTPLEIDGDRVKVRVDATRSFASTEEAGSFSESLTQFRQTVAATAEVRFGESLVLSGLSESVNDSGSNRTPVLGAMPVVGALFNERSSLERRDAALILVTPSPVTRIATSDWARPAAVQNLARLWTQVVDPASNATDVAARLAHARLFTRALPGDSPLSWKDGGDLRSLESLLLSTHP